MIAALTAIASRWRFNRRGNPNTGCSSLANEPLPADKLYKAAAGWNPSGKGMAPAYDRASLWAPEERAHVGKLDLDGVRMALDGVAWGQKIPGGALARFAHSFALGGNVIWEDMVRRLSAAAGEQDETDLWVDMSLRFVREYYSAEPISSHEDADYSGIRLWDALSGGIVHEGFLKTCWERGDWKAPLNAMAMTRLVWLSALEEERVKLEGFSRDEWDFLVKGDLRRWCRIKSREAGVPEAWELLCEGVPLEDILA